MAVDIERARKILVTLHKFCDKIGHDTKQQMPIFLVGAFSWGASIFCRL